MRSTAAILLFSLATAASFAQQNTVGDRIQASTTLIITASGNGTTIMGTGFFYHKLEDKPPAPQPQWVAIQRMWLATNRHVILGNPGSESLPSSLTFHLRQVIDQKLQWLPVVLDQSAVLQRTKCHSNPAVDVCVVDILDLITERAKTLNNLLPWSGVSSVDLPNASSPSVDVGDDVLIVGYPRGFYDQVNLVPIVKAGIIASKWGAPFGGQPLFMVDAKLFPGSSGSLVITKPRDFAIIGGVPKFSNEKRFNFLGLYSGEPFQQQAPVDLEDFVIIRKAGFNLGVVWYGQLLEEVISQGVSLSKPGA
jgi:hypothetical protein